jgi:hypothetical protein
MPAIRLVLALVALCGAAHGADSWMPLFNGKNLDGWEVTGESVWSVTRDGTLVGQRDLLSALKQQPFMRGPGVGGRGPGKCSPAAPATDAGAAAVTQPWAPALGSRPPREVNGWLVVEHPGDPARPKAGPIGLQLHDQFSLIMFRNIRVREIGK